MIKGGTARCPMYDVVGCKILVDDLFLPRTLRVAVVQRFLQPSGFRCSHVDNGMDNEKGGRILNEDIAVRAYYDIRRCCC